MSDCFFNKGAGFITYYYLLITYFYYYYLLLLYNFSNKKFPIQVLSCEFCEVLSSENVAELSNSNFGIELEIKIRRMMFLL